MEVFNNPFSLMERSCIQKLSREIMDLTDIMTKVDLVDIYRTFNLNTKE